MAPYSSILAWKIPWTEEPGRLQSMGSLRVGHDWATSLSLFLFMHWRRTWQPTPVFLPGESRGWRSLEGTVHGVAQSWTWLRNYRFAHYHGFAHHHRFAHLAHANRSLIWNKPLRILFFGYHFFLFFFFFFFWLMCFKDRIVCQVISVYLICKHLIIAGESSLWFSFCDTGSWCVRFPLFEM